MNAIYRHFRKSLPDSLRTSRRVQAALVLGGILLLMLMLQLFRFERFPELLQSLTLFRDEAVATGVAVGVVIVELAALPYLLGVTMRPRLRHISAGLVVLVFAWWFVLTAWGMGQPTRPDQMVMFGDTLAVPFGAGSLVVAGVLFAAAIMVVRGRQIMRQLAASVEKPSAN